MLIIASNYGKYGGSVAATTFTLTVPSGKVASDLAGFPLPIDLSDMPVDFWAGVNIDGTNIRAFTSDGVTAIPLDMAVIEADKERGWIIVRTDVTTASDTDIVIKLTADTALEADAGALGRNAVWSGFEVVWFFPQEVNRTGLGYTQDMSRMEPQTEWVRVGYDSLSGNPHQGIATDGTNFWSFNTNAIRRMDMAKAVLNSTTNVWGDLATFGLANVDHVGDGCVVGGNLYLTVTTSTGSGERWLCAFDKTTLAVVSTVQIPSPHDGHGASVGYDGTNLLLVAYAGAGDYILKLTLAGAVAGTIPLSTVISGAQGITVRDGGNMLITTSPAVRMYEVEPGGTNLGNVYTDPHSDICEGLEFFNDTLYMLKGNGKLITLKADEHFVYRRMHNGWIWATLPKITTWTAGVQLFLTNANAQTGFIALGNGTSYSQSTGAYRDKGPDLMDVWNSADGWLRPTIEIDPLPYEDHQLAFGYDGTTSRKLIVNGTHLKTETGVTAKPSGAGTNMEFVINAALRDGSETGSNNYQFAWLYNGYLSNDFVEAMQNSRSDAGFYTVA